MMTASQSPLTDSSTDRFQLVAAGDRLSLVDTENPALAPISVDFPAHLLTPRGRSELASQPLIRAMGRRSRTVVDATAGMGQDSFSMAVFGFDVIAVERAEQITALLANGLERVKADTELNGLINGRLHLLQGDAAVELQNMTPPPEVVYLDPMYPPKRKKSALAKKEMQILRELVGNDLDADKLFGVARQVATERVVVKRPHHAEPIAPKPSMSYEGKLIRFDVYLTSIPGAGGDQD